MFVCKGRLKKKRSEGQLIGKLLDVTQLKKTIEPYLYEEFEVKKFKTKSNEIAFLCCYFCPSLQSFVPYWSYASATKQENNTMLFDLTILNYFAGFSCCEAT